MRFNFVSISHSYCKVCPNRRLSILWIHSTPSTWKKGKKKTIWNSIYLFDVVLWMTFYLNRCWNSFRSTAPEPFRIVSALDVTDLSITTYNDCFVDIWSTCAHRSKTLNASFRYDARVSWIKKKKLNEHSSTLFTELRKTFIQTILGKWSVINFSNSHEMIFHFVSAANCTKKISQLIRSFHWFRVLLKTEDRWEWMTRALFYSSLNTHTQRHILNEIRNSVKVTFHRSFGKFSFRIDVSTPKRWFASERYCQQLGKSSDI